SPDLLVMASALVETVAGKVQRKLEVVRTLSGSELVGRRYRPPFGDYYEKHGAKTGTRADGSAAPLYWYVADASFVETTSGSGVVHIAPAFGEVDFDLLKTEREKFTEDARPELLCAVGPDGKFTDEAPAYSGRWVKEADKDISRQLRQEGKVYHHEQYLHDYPFCWRAEEDPLIQYPRKSWFIRTTKFKESMLANNAEINWLPEHIKDGRFGNYLESNVDWSLSRERFWGTPLPIWVCEKTGKREAIASYDELLAKPGASGQEVWLAAKKANPELVDDLKVHKPYIDAVTYDSPFAAGAKMKRVTEVIDCWFDSGAMPFAQWGWPHQNADKFRSQFPADFISEALDQTRGWFYSLLSISTLLFSEQARQEQGAAALLPKNVAPPEAAFPHPFRNCIVLGLMLGEDGTKLSKSKKNYRSPDELFDRYGADALRWYFYSGQAPWSEIRYNEQSIKDSLPEFLLRLWNVYSFFVNYANAEGFDPATLVQGKVGDLPASQLRSAQGARPVAQRRELDRYILSELHRTVAVVSTEMDAYNNFGAAKALNEFVDVLSNWYLRLSRGFFSSGRSESAHREATLDAYWTLYECLTTVTKLVAPFTPFFAETLWKNLVRTPFGDRALESVHLADFPVVDETAIDALLSSQMKLGREIVSLGRAARAEAKLKVRQPLAKVEVILADPTHQNWLREHREFAADELNVHEVEMATDADQYISYVVLPDLKKLGKRLGKLLPLVKAALGKADGAKLMHDLQKTGETTLTVDGQNVALTRDDLIVRLEAKPGWAAAQGEQAVVVLSTEITPKLAREGLAREIVHTIQSARKDIGCDFADKIDVALVGGGPDVQAVVGEFADYIGSETQALSLVQEPLSGVSPVEIEVGGAKASLYVAVSAAAAGRPQA
ncbi:MAG TPA: class I tRNA ligase family protein, partial [Pirellulales bacterium]